MGTHDRLRREARPPQPRRRWWSRTAAVFTVAIATSACAAQAETPETLVLRFADGHSATHPIPANGTKYFLEQLEEKGSDVGLEIEYYPGQQLGKFADAPTMLATGIADIAAVAPAYLSASMPLTSVFDLPGYTADSCAGARAATRALSEGSTLRETELEPVGVHPIWSVFYGGYELMTAEVADDPHGQAGAILRSPGGAVDRVVHEMGAAGVSMPLGEMYEAIERGTVEGTVASPMSMAPYGLSEVLQHSTIGADLGAVTVIYAVAEDKWESLTDAQRQVITEAAQGAEQNLCEAVNDYLPESRVQMEQDGTVLNYLSPEQKAQWRTEITLPARESWMTDLSSMGLPAEAVLSEWESALAAEGVTND